MLQEIILSAALSFTPTEKKIVDNLQTKLKKEGYDISRYLEDSRFEVYTFKRGKQTNYADTTQSWYMRTDSLEKCADFIEEQYFWLKKVEDEFGPSPEHITSQLQLETNRGQYTGERPLINSFISVYIDRPDRRNEFYRYLTDFLDLFADTTDNIVFPKDIFDVEGSWAGAYGVAQMMPDVLKKYGKILDFDGDSIFDPMNLYDAMGFMGMYLAAHGFGKSQSKATQLYNKGHKFYGSSIGIHTDSLENIMKRRSRIPPKKIFNYPCPTEIVLEPVKYNKLKAMNLAAIIPQLPKKQQFIRRIFSKRKR